VSQIVKMNSRVEECKIIELPVINDPRGNLTFIEGGRHIPFEIKRVYYLYDVPGGASRAGHGHRKLWREIENFSGGSVCMVLASEFYDETDYFRHYPDFIRAARGKG
jgi:hypothetical protein